MHAKPATFFVIVEKRIPINKKQIIEKLTKETMLHICCEISSDFLIKTAFQKCKNISDISFFAYTKPASFFVILEK